MVGYGDNAVLRGSSSAGTSEPALKVAAGFSCSDRVMSVQTNLRMILVVAGSPIGIGASESSPATSTCAWFNVIFDGQLRWHKDLDFQYAAC